MLAPDGQPAVAAEMPFLDHLEELRWHLFKAIAGIGVAVVVVYIGILAFLRAPELKVAGSMLRRFLPGR